MKKLSFSLVGFLQALGVIAYIALVSNVMRMMETAMTEPPVLMGMMTILLMLVFSAGFTGLCVFGYPVYLALQKQWKEALTVLAYTFASLFLIGLALVGSLFFFWS